jgi:hypothetical protein
MKKVPRGFKAKIKKIPAGSYCYGEFLGSKPKKENGKLVFKGGGALTGIGRKESKTKTV